MPGSGHDVYNQVFDESAGVWRPQPYSVAVSGTVSGGGGETLTKAVESQLIDITTVSGGDFSLSDVLDVSYAEEVTLWIDHAPLTTSAPVAGTEYRVEGSTETNTDKGWRPLAVFRTGTVAAATVNAGEACNAGDTLVSLGSTPAYTAVESIFFQNFLDILNSEWAKLAKVTTNVSLHLHDPLTETQSSSAVFNKCEHFVVTLPVKSIMRVRAVCDNSIHANSFLLAWRCAATTGRGGA